MKITLPNGKQMEKEEVLANLELDRIVVKEPDTEKVKYIKKYYDSNLKVNILASIYPTLDNLKKYLNTRLNDLLTLEFIEKELPDVKKSTPIIIKTILNNEHTLCLVDSDVDGVTSGAIEYKMFKNIFKYDNFEIITNKRKNGNGINNNIMNQTIAYNKRKEIGMVFLSDHGSHDRENLTTIKNETNASVIVTDHHLYDDETAPFNMDAFINPQRWETPLKDMTGAGIAYYTLLHAYLTMVEEGHMKQTEETLDYIYYLLSYVGLTIISDCMDLKNYINRKIIKKALLDLNNVNMKHEPFWDYIIKKFASTTIIDEMTLGYNVIPMLNSSGRISDPRFSYELLISENPEDTKRLYEDVSSINDKRKKIQTKAAKTENKIEFSTDAIKVMYIENSNGVQGIIANNVMYNEDYKVVIVFTQNEPNGVFSGSGRSRDENISLKEIIDTIAENNDIVIQHGGHNKAIGLKIKPDLKKFFTLLKTELEKHKIQSIEKTYVTDYIFSVKKLLLNIFDLYEIGPFGIGFPKPLFASDFYIQSYRLIKKSSTMLMMKIKFNKNTNLAISLFYIVKDHELDYFEDMLQKTKYIRVAYTVNINSYRNLNKIIVNPEQILFKHDF